MLNLWPALITGVILAILGCCRRSVWHRPNNSRQQADEPNNKNELRKSPDELSIFPITPLVRQVQGLILQTFEVSEQAAQDYAAEMVALAEGWGSREHAPNLDWPMLVKKDLGSKLEWKLKDERAVFMAERKQALEVNIVKRKRNRFI